MRRRIALLIIFNSLVASAQSGHIKVSLRNGTTIEGEVKEFDALDHITIIVGSLETTIPMSEVAYVSNVVEKSQKETESVTGAISDTPRNSELIDEDPLNGFKGFLLAKSNKVYVESSNSDGNKKAQYDKEGAMVIRTFLERDGFWTVVDKRNKAHFIIHYRVNTDKRDMAQLTINARRTRISYLLGSSKTNESELKNNVIAQHFYNKAIKPLQTKIEKGKTPKKLIEDFTIK